MNQQRRFKAAAIQFRPHPTAKAANIDRLETLAREAAAEGARLIVMPEMATVGMFWPDPQAIAPYAEPIPGPTTARFAALAREWNVYIVVGMPEIDPATGALYNAAALVGPEGVIGHHRKVHAFLGDPMWATDGDLGFRVWETELGRLGLMICMDANYPESSLLLAHQGADVLVMPVGWLDEACPAPLWIQRAFDSQLPAVAANRWGPENGFQFSGGSAILAADGSVLACLGNGPDDAIVYAEIEPANDRQDVLPPARPELYRSLTLNRYLWNPAAMHRHFGASPMPPGAVFRLVACETRPSGQGIDAYLSVLDERLARSGPALVVLPEYSFTAIPRSRDEARAVAESLNGPTVTALAEWCARTGHMLVAGLVEEDGGDLYSTLVLAAPSGVCARYRKAHLAPGEQSWLSAGDSLVTADLPLGRIGLLAGTDLLRPEPCRVLANEGADVICVASSLDWPTPRSLAQTTANPADPSAIHWHLPRVRAAESDVYVAYTSRANGQTPASSAAAGIFFGPVLYHAPAVEAWAGPDDAPIALACLDVDTRPGDGAAPVNPVRSKPGMAKRLPALYAPLLQPADERVTTGS